MSKMVNTPGAPVKVLKKVDYDLDGPIPFTLDYEEPKTPPRKTKTMVIPDAPPRVHRTKSDSGIVVGKNLMDTLAGMRMKRKAEQLAASLLD